MEQKTKVKWAKEGDCNSGFFHRIASGRRNKNFIGPLIKGNGERTLSDKEVEEEVLSEFLSLFSPSIEPRHFVQGVD